MAELKDPYQVWEQRVGLIEVGRIPMMYAQKAVARSLLTMDRVVEFFERVLPTLLGERAWIDAESGGTRRRLYVRDAAHPDWLLRVPLLEHAWFAGIGQISLGTSVNSGAVNPVDKPDDWKRGDTPRWPQDAEPDILPQNPNMHGGSLKIAEGTGHAAIKYDDRRVRSESCWSSGGDKLGYARAFNVRLWEIDPLARPPKPKPFSLAGRPELDLRGPSFDQVVEREIALEPARFLPHRVLLQLPAPGGVEGAWIPAQWALREAAFNWRLNGDTAGRVIVDVFEGKALTVGSDFGTAVLRRWKQVACLPPRPPKPPKHEQAAEPMPNSEPEFVKDGEKRAAFVSTGTIRREWYVDMPGGFPNQPLRGEPPFGEIHLQCVGRRAAEARAAEANRRVPGRVDRQEHQRRPVGVGGGEDVEGREAR